jgi:DNA-binding NarL/FixJ family response regulator
VTVDGRQDGRKGVLIVDESADVRRRLSAVVSDIEGVEVVGEACGSAEALEFCRVHRPAVVTMDLIFSDESGVEALRKLREMEPPPRIVVLTNYPYPVLEKRCLDLGAECFLNKATEFEKIRRILSEPSAEGAGA